jgi:hypothetical protein
MASPYEDLHRLVDRLPQHAAGELLNFALYLEQKEHGQAGAKARALLNAAPLDDEPYTDDERAEVRASRDDYRRHGGVSLDELLGETGA